MSRMTAFVLIVCAGGIGNAQPAPLPSKFEPAAVDAYLAAQVKVKNVVGLSAVVTRAGQPLFAKGYGVTALKAGAPVTADTPLAIGSITKQFTCACLFLLSEEGKLSVRDPVSKYYPHLTSAAEITLYDLMTHASGYPDYYPLDFLDRRMKQPIELDDLLKQYAGGKLDFAPGTRWSYSNTGYILLGRVIEKVSGEPFGAFLTRRILTPLGMTNSMFEPKPGTPGISQGHYSILLGPPETATSEANGWIHAAGGLYCSANDLVKWNEALHGGKVLQPQSYKLMTTPRELKSGKIHDYGCGIGITRMNGETVYGHTGGVSGFNAYNTTIPRLKASVVLLHNGEHADAAALHRQLLQLLLKDEAARDEVVPKISGPSTKDAAIALFKQLQAGAVDRAQLGEEFNIFMSEDRVKSAASRLQELGEPTTVEVEGMSERGGMEEARIRFAFKSGAIRASMYRSTDGKIQQFLLKRG